MTAEVGVFGPLHYWKAYVARFHNAATRQPDEDDYTSPRRIAQRFRSICAEHGPFEVAKAVGYETGEYGRGRTLQGSDMRYLAYLLAHATAADDALELCVEQGVLGFDDWLRVNR